MSRKNNKELVFVSLFLFSSILNAETQVVDNTDPEFGVVSGQWKSDARVGGYVATDYLIIDGENYSGEVEWNLNVTGEHHYEVFARWTDGYTHSNSVAYTVTDRNGTHQIIVDQTRNGGVWYSLGMYTSPSKVTLDTSGANGELVADAIKVEANITSLSQVYSLAYGVYYDNIGTSDSCSVRASLNTASDIPFMVQDENGYCHCQAGSSLITLSKEVNVSNGGRNYTYFQSCVSNAELNHVVSSYKVVAYSNLIVRSNGSRQCTVNSTILSENDIPYAQVDENGDCKCNEGSIKVETGMTDESINGSLNSTYYYTCVIDN